ncbi:PA0069 family radical SAM protein [Rhodohalobacter halophilus]|uniref:PA0069 family radical SAM protein n=1 Tax=Rhodohalobacter halophilus TaxID=1812810 RepID=UPI00083F9CEE|nr:PA0069 family radical SAM protein [Rhodohalobacter halophilus]
MSQPIKGRGSAQNPKNRFLKTNLEYEIDSETGQLKKPKTQLLKDHTSDIISRNQSPDIPFDVGLNPYRGCEHGCVYCYARPTHEFLGMSAGLDFESKIVVKYNAPELLKKALADHNWKPQTLVMSGVTDPYQPIEKDLEITRRCVKILADCHHPLGIITKNYLVTRDIDHLKELAEIGAVGVTISLTSLRPEITNVMEPRTSRPARRLKAIEELTKAGIPVNVNIAPIIPGLTDDEIVPMMETAANAGASSMAYTIVRLPYGVKDIFSKWLEDHFPDRKDKVLNRIRSLKSGELNRSGFGERFRSEGPYGEQIRQLVNIHRNRLGLTGGGVHLNGAEFRRPSMGQLNLFG